jgi:hypothetical protein
LEDGVSGESTGSATCEGYCEEKLRKQRNQGTSSIALLVGTALNPLLPRLALGIDAFFANAILDAAKAWAGVVALFAGLLAVGACILDLATLWTGCRRREELGRLRLRKGIHVERNGERVLSVHRA